MSVRLLLALAMAAVPPLGSTVAFARPAASPALVAQVPGPALAQALRQAFASVPGGPGPAVGFVSRSGTLRTLQERAASAGGGADVLLMPNAGVLAACRQGLLLSLDRAEIGIDDATSARASTCGLPAFDEPTVLAWDMTRDHTPPQWQDFWDVARYPGKRGLPLHARGPLEVALMADGVAPRDVYRVLGSSDGVARAFRKLDQLRPYLVWWTDGGTAIRALETGLVMMTMAPATLVPTADRNVKAASIGQQWADGLIETLAWAVPAAAPDPQAAMRFLRLVRDPARQAIVAGLVPLVPLAPADPDASAATAQGGGALERAGGSVSGLRHGFRIDDSFWLDHPELEGRFDAWATSSR